jgi:integrase
MTCRRACRDRARGRVFRTESIRTGFDNAVERAGLEGFHFHDLRHHFASWFMMRGGNLQELREILGHADLKMTMRYAHLSPAHLRTAMLRTDRNGASSEPTVSTISAHSSVSEVRSPEGSAVTI